MSKSVYETHIMPDSYLPFKYNLHIIRRGRNNNYNWHENIELLRFVSGEGRVGLGTEWNTVVAGDIAVVNSETLHTIVSDSEVRYDCLIIDRSFCEDNGIDVFGVNFKSIITDPALYECFDRLTEDMALIRAGSAPIYALPSARLHVLDILTRLCRDYIIESGVDAAHTASSQMTKEVITYLREHIRDSVSLDAISESVGVSKYHLSREFKRVTGLTIFEHLNVFRCKTAMRMIYAGSTVSEAAEACGFENLSYFSRSFKKYMGILPSACIGKRE